MDRNRRSQTERLDRFVRDNRVTIAVVFPLVGAALLVASAEGLLWDPLAFNPFLVLVGTAVMRLPLIAGLLPVVDRRLVGVLIALTGYTYAIEYVGLTTGWPYGEFQYTVALGPMLGGVPLALPLFFLPLVLNATLLSTLLTDSETTNWPVRVVGAVLAVITIDLVLDPAAVSIGFWAYDGAGPYYGVPLSNYLGWLLSGTIAVVALEYGLRTDQLRTRLRSCEFALDDLVSFVVLWGGINALYGNWIPVSLAGALVGALLWTGRIDLTTDSHRLPTGNR
ncbi:carotene biosynthesis associated membrane protein [Halovivax asiaticus JCM 14624]|uniref:Carotene biosynthesis associated membrane protein n=1 Tax=Halovivax asiaticus JCM 14624 TaxID=1227490 RepID=M0BRY1_9EURY|nr:bisanhydrobacterioruberin hydratase [Halovivax asiaticus]ELZ13695.1 carotene biosynthesis associated membrane protein [Halovivax asiaticus JCM 14624]